jgi:hypothetical protein
LWLCHVRIRLTLSPPPLFIKLPSLQSSHTTKEKEKRIEEEEEEEEEEVEEEVHATVHITTTYVEFSRSPCGLKITIFF